MKSLQLSKKVFTNSTLHSKSRYTRFARTISSFVLASFLALFISPILPYVGNRPLYAYSDDFQTILNHTDLQSFQSPDYTELDQYMDDEAENETSWYEGVYSKLEVIQTQWENILNEKIEDVIAEVQKQENELGLEKTDYQNLARVLLESERQNALATWRRGASAYIDNEFQHYLDTKKTEEYEKDKKDDTALKNATEDIVEPDRADLEIENDPGSQLSDELLAIPDLNDLLGNFYNAFQTWSEQEIEFYENKEDWIISNKDEIKKGLNDWDNSIEMLENQKQKHLDTLDLLDAGWETRQSAINQAGEKVMSTLNSVLISLNSLIENLKAEQNNTDLSTTQRNQAKTRKNELISLKNKVNNAIDDNINLSDLARSLRDYNRNIRDLYQDRLDSFGMTQMNGWAESDGTMKVQNDDYSGTEIENNHNSVRDDIGLDFEFHNVNSREGYIEIGNSGGVNTVTGDFLPEDGNCTELVIMLGNTSVNKKREEWIYMNDTNYHVMSNTLLPVYGIAAWESIVNSSVPRNFKTTLNLDSMGDSYFNSVKGRILEEYENIDPDDPAYSVSDLTGAWYTTDGIKVTESNLNSLLTSSKTLVYRVNYKLIFNHRKKTKEQYIAIRDEAVKQKNLWGGFISKLEKWDQQISLFTESKKAAQDEIELARSEAITAYNQKINQMQNARDEWLYKNYGNNDDPNLFYVTDDYKNRDNNSASVGATEEELLNSDSAGSLYNKAMALWDIREKEFYTKRDTWLYNAQIQINEAHTREADFIARSENTLIQINEDVEQNNTDSAYNYDVAREQWEQAEFDDAAAYLYSSNCYKDSEIAAIQHAADTSLMIHHSQLRSNFYAEALKAAAVILENSPYHGVHTVSTLTASSELESISQSHEAQLPIWENIRQAHLDNKTNQNANLSNQNVLLTEINRASDVKNTSLDEEKTLLAKAAERFETVNELQTRAKEAESAGDADAAASYKEQALLETDDINLYLQQGYSTIHKYVLEQISVKELTVTANPMKTIVAESYIEKGEQSNESIAKRLEQLKKESIEAYQNAIVYAESQRALEAALAAQKSGNQTKMNKLIAEATALAEANACKELAVSAKDHIATLKNDIPENLQVSSDVKEMLGNVFDDLKKQWNKLTGIGNNYNDTELPDVEMMYEFAASINQINLSVIVQALYETIQRSIAEFKNAAKSWQPNINKNLISSFNKSQTAAKEKCEEEGFSDYNKFVFSVTRDNEINSTRKIFSGDFKCKGDPTKPDSYSPKMENQEFSMFLTLSPFLLDPSIAAISFDSSELAKPTAETINKFKNEFERINIEKENFIVALNENVDDLVSLYGSKTEAANKEYEQNILDYQDNVKSEIKRQQNKMGLLGKIASGISILAAPFTGGGSLLIAAVINASIESINGFIEGGWRGAMMGMASGALNTYIQSFSGNLLSVDLSYSYEDGYGASTGVNFINSGIDIGYTENGGLEVEGEIALGELSAEASWDEDNGLDVTASVNTDSLDLKVSFTEDSYSQSIGNDDFMIGMGSSDGDFNLHAELNVEDTIQYSGTIDGDGNTDWNTSTTTTFMDNELTIDYGSAGVTADVTIPYPNESKDVDGNSASINNPQTRIHLDGNSNSATVNNSADIVLKDDDIGEVSIHAENTSTVDGDGVSSDNSVVSINSIKPDDDIIELTQEIATDILDSLPENQNGTPYLSEQDKEWLGNIADRIDGKDKALDALQDSVEQAITDSLDSISDKLSSINLLDPETPDFKEDNPLNSDWVDSTKNSSSEELRLSDDAYKTRGSEEKRKEAEHDAIDIVK